MQYLKYNINFFGHQLNRSQQGLRNISVKIIACVPDVFREYKGQRKLIAVFRDTMEMN